jgi:hypothetical protein
VTVAVRVTDVPEVDGFRLELTTALDAAFSEGKLRALDVEVLLDVSPA